MYETYLSLNEQDGASLIKAMVSKEGKFFRQQLCKIIVDLLYQWMIKLFGQGITVTQYSRVVLANGPSNKESGLSPRSSLPTYDYNSIFRDRRLRVIFSKVLKSASRDKILMLRFSWASLLIIITASTLACHQLVVSLSEAYLGKIFDAPKRYAVSVWNFLKTFTFLSRKRAFLSNDNFPKGKRKRKVYFYGWQSESSLFTANKSICVCSLSWVC